LRDILTLVAGALILVLTAALIGPWFIDWTAHRGWVESELSRVSGARVRVTGAVDLKILPVPRLELARVHVSGARGDGPVLDIAAVRLELAAASLLRGELRFTDALLERPQMTLVRQPDGALVLPRMPDFAPNDVQVERLTIRDGSVALRRPQEAQPIVVGGLDFLGEASSLIGPFKGAGQIKIGSEPVKWRFSSAQIENERLRVKIIVDESPLAPRADLEGVLSFAEAPSGVRPAFEGAAVFSGTDRIAGVPVVWRLAGAIVADASGARMDGAEMRAGDEERALAASGHVSLGFGERPHLEAQFAARQFDVDRLFDAGLRGALSAGERLVSLAAAALSDSGLSESLPFPVHVILSSPAAVLAGETLSDLRAEVRLDPQAAPRIAFAAQGPARSAISLDGSVETGAAAAFRGKVDLSLRDVARFSDWLSLSLPDAARRLRELPFRLLDLEGDVDVSAAGALGRRLTLRLDRSEARGTMAFTRATGAEPARLFADLSSDALDLDGIPELSGPARFAAGMDLSLGLEARAVRLERFGAGFVDAGRIGLKLVKDGRNVRLERFAIENIGGANVSANARFEERESVFEARVDAARLGELAALVQRLAPGPLADQFARRATALSPARLSVSGRGRGADLLQDLRIEGAVRGTRVSAIAQPAGESIDVSLSAENPDAILLLRQLGFEPLPLSNQGAARLGLRARGSSAHGFETSAQLNAARSEFFYDGRILGPVSALEAKGAARLRSSDLAPFLRLMAVVLPDASLALPSEATADLSIAQGQIALERVSGMIGGSFVSANLRNLLEGESRRFEGEVKVDRISAQALAALALGPMPVPARQAIWPEQKFAPGLIDPSRIDLRIEAAHFDLSETRAARDARFDLRIAPGLVALEKAQMNFAGGRLGGQFTLRRDGASASLAGHADLADIAWLLGPLDAKASGRVDFTSTGQSHAALAAGLAGSGRIVLANARLAGADPAAIGRLIDHAEANRLNIEESDLRARLLRELERAPLALPQQAYELAMAAGVLRLSPENDSATRFSLSYDMRNLAAGLRVELISPHAPRDWQGAAPSAAVIWQERAGGFQRMVDFGPLFATISARAILRESARIEVLEADIRERAAFNRRVRADDFMRRRGREIGLWQEEQRRREVELQRRRAEEERQRALTPLPATGASPDPLSSGRY
jgi:uncharacterized protein involved in outer membrane biogenesis